MIELRHGDLALFRQLFRQQPCNQYIRAEDEHEAARDHAAVSKHDDDPASREEKEAGIDLITVQHATKFHDQRLARSINLTPRACGVNNAPAIIVDAFGPHRMKRKATLRANENAPAIIDGAFIHDVQGIQT